MRFFKRKVKTFEEAKSATLAEVMDGVRQESIESRVARADDKASHAIILIYELMEYLELERVTTPSITKIKKVKKEKNGKKDS